MKLQLTNYSKFYHITENYELRISMSMYRDNMGRYSISLHNKEKDISCASIQFNMYYEEDNKHLVSASSRQNEKEIEDFVMEFVFDTFELTIHSDKYDIDDTISIQLVEVLP